MAAASYYQLGSYPPKNPTMTAETTHTDTSYHSLPHEPASTPLKPSQHGPAQHEPVPQAPQPLKFSSPNDRLRRQKYEKLKRYLRILKVVTKAVTVLFSAIMFGGMVFMSIKFNTTKGVIRDGRNPWPKAGTKLWPTIMLLVGAGFTLALSFATLISYCFCFDKSRRSWKITVVKYVIHIVGWLVISFLYRYEKSLHGDNNDLWGWSCSQEATVVQTEFKGVVDFEALCNIQVRKLIASVETHY